MSSTIDPAQPRPADQQPAAPRSDGLEAGGASGQDDHGGRGTPRSEASRRRRVLLGVAVVAVALAVGGWLGSLLVKSPAQVAAETAAPPASVITAGVERRVVADQVIVRGQVVADQTVEAVPTVVPAGVTRAVVSGAAVAAGSAVVAGAVLVEVSGRPVIALTGTVPAYRDLGPGAVGRDVQQLQDALAQLGFSRGADPVGAYGDGTTAAVAALYSARGYEPVGGAGSASLPAGEVVFVARFPARVETAQAVLGQDASTASVRLSSGALRVLVEATGQTAGLVRAGAQVQITSEVLGETADGTVAAGSAPAAAPDDPATGAAAAASPAAAPAGGTGVASGTDAASLVVEPTAPLSSAWAGQDVRVTVASAASDGPVLAVPVTAVYAGADGTTSVLIAADGTGGQRRVEVEPGVAGGGWVEVTPVGADLAEGTAVVVGAGG